MSATDISGEDVRKNRIKLNKIMRTNTDDLEQQAASSTEVALVSEELVLIVPPMVEVSDGWTLAGDVLYYALLLVVSLPLWFVGTMIFIPLLLTTACTFLIIFSCLMGWAHKCVNFHEREWRGRLPSWWFTADELEVYDKHMADPSTEKDPLPCFGLCCGIAPRNYIGYFSVFVLQLSLTLFMHWLIVASASFLSGSGWRSSTLVALTGNYCHQVPSVSLSRLFSGQYPWDISVLLFTWLFY